MAEPPRYPGAPRWVKISGAIAVGILILLVVLAVAGGGRHGPQRHMSAVEAPSAPR